MSIFEHICAQQTITKKLLMVLFQQTLIYSIYLLPE